MKHDGALLTPTPRTPVIESSGFAYRGTVVWLTPEQGGRRSGPPTDVGQWPYYAATGWLPPLTAAGDGLRSLLLRGFVSGQWRSPAEARWLVELEDYPQVVAGSVLVVSEGPRPVGFFVVDHVDLVAR